MFLRIQGSSNYLLSATLSLFKFLKFVIICNSNSPITLQPTLSLYLPTSQSDSYPNISPVSQNDASSLDNPSTTISIYPTTSPKPYLLTVSLLS